MSGPGSTGDSGRLYECVRRGELPTWLVAAAIYGGWVLLTLYAALLPWWIAAPALGCVIGWHNSLQHEAIHGHPTRYRAVNDALAMPPLGLWLPYRSYRRVHLLHHRVSLLTDPGTDPESFYVTAGQWRRLPRLARWLTIFNNTLLGRLSVGPAIVVARFWWAEIRALTGGDGRRVAREWWPHLVLVALLLWWVAACGMALWVYLLAAHFGLSLTLHRSFDEHRPAEGRDAGSVTVEAGLFWRLLYLGNNFHALHHRRPDMPWFRLRQTHLEERGGRSEPANGFAYRGYADIFGRYLVRPRDTPVHPFPARAPVPPEGRGGEVSTGDNDKRRRLT